VTLSDLAGSRTIVLPFSDFANPIVQSDAHHQLLCSSLAAGGLPTRIACLVDEEHAWPAGARTIARARWHGVPVPADVGDAEPVVSPAARRAIRKAEREGVRVDVVDDDRFLHEFYRLHLGVRKHKYRLLPQPRAFFAAIRDRFTAANGWWPLVALHGGRVVAATLYLQWGDTLYYKFNASDPGALTVRPNDLLVWEGIRLAQRVGCRLLDLGRSDDDQPGLIRFKRGFGGQERELRTVELPPTASDDPKADAGTSAQTRRALAQATRLLTDPDVPDRATEVAGSVLYRLFA
jgi:CelD/BcsL family acetyltransferase involved in cellulose biosynthesis